MAAPDALLPNHSGTVLMLSTPLGVSTDFSTRHQCPFWTTLGVKPVLIG